MFMNKAMTTTTSDFLKSVPVERTNTYTPISHRQIIDETLFLFKKHGLTVQNELYTECLDGKIAQGNYTLNVQDSEMALELVWQNSTNKQVSFKYAIGSRIFACTNGCIYGDLDAYKRIHKGTADTEAIQKMNEFVSKMESNFQNMITIRDRMKEIEVTKRTCAELIGRLFAEEEIISITQVGIIKRELENPSFDYGVENSLWNFYQHCTHSFKEITPRVWLPKQIELSKFLTTEYQELELV